MVQFWCHQSFIIKSNRCKITTALIIQIRKLSCNILSIISLVSEELRDQQPALPHPGRRKHSHDDVLSHMNATEHHVVIFTYCPAHMAQVTLQRYI